MTRDPYHTIQRVREIGVALGVDVPEQAGALQAMVLRDMAKRARALAAACADHAVIADIAEARERRWRAAHESHAAKLARGERCAVAWRRVPDRAEYAHLVGIDEGHFVVDFGALGSRRYSIRRGGLHSFDLSAGQVDVAATLDLWHAFCAARRAP